MRVTYVPGAWNAVVSEQYALLLDDSVDDERLDGIWTAMTATTDVEALLDSISGGRLAGLPTFALAGLGPDGVRILVRPGARVVVDHAGPTEREVTCDGWRMWADVLVDRRAWVRLARDPAGPESAVLPLVGGVVRADQLTWRAVDITPDDVEQATPDVAPPSPLPPAPSTIVLEPVPVQPPPLPPPLPVAATPDEAPHEGPDFFDELWGMTQPRTVESAAVREDDEEDLGPALLDIIPGLSGAASAPATPGPAPSTPEPAPDTVMGVRPVTTRQQVLAISCPQGHPNPPTTSTCRECGAAVTYSEPAPATRPRLGVLRFSTGQTVELDQSVLIGRNPTVARVAGLDLPTIVPLDSTNRGISRTHAEVRLDDWNVLLVDLGSSNGTFAMIPGRAEARLEADAPFPLVPGTVVRLAHDVTFTFEVR